MPHVSIGQPEASDSAHYADPNFVAIGDHSSLPASHLPVTQMDNQLLVGSFQSNVSGVGYLMVVDLRTELVNASAGQKPTLGPRNATLQIHPACSPSIVLGHGGGWSAGAAALLVWDEASRSLSLGLEAGGGALIKASRSSSRQ